MMYVEKFVASLKVNGKFLRDEDGAIKIPFGTEYDLYLKNIESRDAVVSVSIDGKDVLDGNKLVVRGNSSLDLLGFMDGQQVKNKFKFIELTKEIEKHLGYSPEDSIIRIEFWFKKMKPIVQEINTIYKPHWEYPYYPYMPYAYWYYNDYNGNIYTRGRGSSCGTSVYNDSSCTYSTDAVNCSFTSDIGITVKGNECGQDFSSTYVGDLEEQSHVIILRLSGYKDDKKVETVFTTKDKIECPTCGKKNEYNDRFCSDCGTFLK